MDEMNPITAAAQSVAQNNAWSAEQAQKQMDFQERMSNTAHVREIADLKAAGLNPVLSAKLGGASTPSGAMATGDMSGTTAIVSLFDRMLENQSAEKLLQMRLDNSNEQLQQKFDFEREMSAMNNAVAAAESAGKSGSSGSGSSNNKKQLTGSGTTIKGSSPVKRKDSETIGRERVITPADTFGASDQEKGFGKEMNKTLSDATNVLRGTLVGNIVSDIAKGVIKAADIGANTARVLNYRFDEEEYNKLRANQARLRRES